MVLIGLRTTFAEFGQTVLNWRLVARAGAANYLLVPGAAVVLLILFDASPSVAAGFLILAVCPGAPFGPPFAAIAKANVPMAVGLMVILAGSSAILSPVLLHLLLPWVSGGVAPSIDVFGMVSSLLITQLLPLCLGLFVRHWRPELADRLLGQLELVTKILSLITAGLILSTQWHMLTEIRLRGFAGMLILLVVCLANRLADGGIGKR